ncbi:MAG: hypothetical protein IJM79_02175 [Erysipelotrichaceae bacterium]|nr:hypothetical protein [Erysipelotrichaceae bacterium]
MRIRKTAVIILTAMMLALAGCAGRYRIIVDDKSEWSKIRASYREGENVVLYYKIDATDSTLSIAVDGQSVDYDFIPNYGFRIEFPMPDHDIEIKAVWMADPYGA